MDIDSDEEVKQQQPENKFHFDVTQVVTLLQNILSGDNARIKEATKILRFIIDYHNFSFILLIIFCSQNFHKTNRESRSSALHYSQLPRNPIASNSWSSSKAKHLHSV